MSEISDESLPNLYRTRVKQDSLAECYDIETTVEKQVKAILTKRLKDEKRRRNLISIAHKRRILEAREREISADRSIKKLDKMIALRDIRRQIQNL